jgi:hypothetical protein
LRRVRARDTIIAPDPEGRRRRNRITGIALGLALGGAAAMTPASLLTSAADEPVALLATEDDASVRLPSPRVVVRYAGGNAAAYELAARVASRLGREGYRVAAIQPAAVGAGEPTVRYFFPGDRSETESLADELAATLNRQVNAMLVPAPTAGASAGMIEVWLGPVSG